MKKTILLLHGLRGDHHGLAEVAELLEKRGFNVVNPDLPGYGGSKTFSQKNLETYGEWLHKTIAAQKTKPYIVAHSMGSIIASHYLAKCPDDTQQKVVFVSPIFRSEFSQKSSKIRCVLTNAAFHLLPTKPRLGLMRSKLASWCIAHYLISDRSQTKKIEQMHYKYSGNFESAKGLMADIEISMKEQTVSVEKDVLYIIGAKDRLTAAKLARARAEAQGADFTEFAGTGHLINYEQPERLADRIAEYLQD